MNLYQSTSVLKAFYFGCASIQDISRKTKLSRDEVREVLKGARTCGLIKFSTKEAQEVFVHVEKKKLGEYLKMKGLLDTKPKSTKSNTTKSNYTKPNNKKPNTTKSNHAKFNHTKPNNNK